MWLTEYRLDGLRIDSTIYMRNTEGHDNDPAHDIPEAWFLMQDIVELAHKINPNALMIAEDCANSAYITKPRDETGCGFNAQWELGFPHAIRDALGVSSTSRTLSGVRYELEKQYDGNAFEKVIFSDSHDTAANGSVRLNDAITPRDPTSLVARQTLLLATSMMLTAPGIPMLLQGSEFLQDGAFNDWQALSWERTETYTGLLQAHRHLIDLRLNRHQHTAGLLGQHTAVFHQDDNNAVIGYHRWDNGGAGDDVIVIANFSNTAFQAYQLALPIGGAWYIRFNSTWSGYAKDFANLTVDTITTGERNVATLTLPPYAVLIASQEM